MIKGEWIGLGFWLLLCLIPAFQARRRGYNLAVWALAGLLVTNPVYALVILAAAPYRSRLRLREQFAADLDAKLAAASAVPTAAVAVPVSDLSIGDQPTMGAPSASAARERSLGDEETRLGPPPAGTES